jgi:hypothetical protein
VVANTQQERGSEGYLLYGALGRHRLERCQVVCLHYSKGTRGNK